MRIFITLIILSLFFSCKTEKKQITTERITTNLFSNPKGLNPMIYMGPTDNTVNHLMFSTLCDYNPETLEFEAVLATKVPTPQAAPTDEYPDGIKYEIEIKEEAKWDDGSPVTGEDVLFSLKTIFLPATNAIKYRAYMQDIYDCKVNETNKKKFTVYFKNISINSMELVTNFAILDKDFYDKEGVLSGVRLKGLNNEEAYAQRKDKEELDAYAELFNSTTYSVDSVSGSGPYKLKEWLNDQYVILEKKKGYWGEVIDNVHFNAYPNEIQLIISADKASAFTQLKAGAFDFYEGLSNAQYEELQSNETYASQYNFESVQLQRFYMVILNSRNKKIEDKAVRRALAYLIDVETLIEEAENGVAERINSPFLTVDKYSKLKDIPFDTAEARNLLEEAGWKDTNQNGILDKEKDGELVELELTCISTGSQLGQIIIGTLSQNAEKLGIKINTENLDRSIYQKRLKTHDFDLTVSVKGLSLAPYDPYSMFHSDNTDQGEPNYGNFGNESSDELIDKIRLTLDEKERRKLYLELEKMIYEEQPYIFLYSPTKKMAMKKGVSGITSIKLPGYSLRSFRRKN